ncbi:unnamed protein product [Pleuronectes platessa]|uniref:Uncharacterized protein n=1 Tax=Pleuronectes platessa TaxID=8262 RepID=A0A9N7Z6J3_PLEPL|nr:unnamed protein product [Pleuronectes platessa]
MEKRQTHNHITHHAQAFTGRLLQHVPCSVEGAQTRMGSGSSLCDTQRCRLANPSMTADSRRAHAEKGLRVRVIFLDANIAGCAAVPQKRCQAPDRKRNPANRPRSRLNGGLVARLAGTSCTALFIIHSRWCLGDGRGFWLIKQISRFITGIEATPPTQHQGSDSRSRMAVTTLAPLHHDGIQRGGTQRSNGVSYYRSYRQGGGSQTSRFTSFLSTGRGRAKSSAEPQPQSAKNISPNILDATVSKRKSKHRNTVEPRGFTWMHVLLDVEASLRLSSAKDTQALTLQTETECLDFSKVITNHLHSPRPLERAHPAADRVAGGGPEIAPRKSKPCSGPTGLQSPPVTYMHICETLVFSMGVFLLRPGAFIPLHDHPDMNGNLRSC